MADEVFKIINKMSPEYINDLVALIKTSTYNCRAVQQAEVPRVTYNQVWAEVLQVGGGPDMEQPSK